MGKIDIKLSGSFFRKEFKEKKEFSVSALKYGHARATLDAINYLINLLPSAIRADYNLHEKGNRPENNFGED